MANRKTRTFRVTPEHSSVPASARFTADDPCPVCGGHQSAQTGSGERCWGFRSGDGRSVVCTEIASDHTAGDSEGWLHPTSGTLRSDAASAAPSATDAIEAAYGYENERGDCLFEVVRFVGKRFRQRAADGRWSLSGVRLVPFRLPELIDGVASGKTIYIVEGEKDVESMIAAGEVATCNPMGAGKWRAEYSEYLRGANVIVVADRDDGKGIAHARDVRRSLAGIAASIQIVEAATGKDATDHLDAGNALAELVPVPERFERVKLGAHQVRPVSWLFEPVLLRRTHTTLTSDAGTGKTLVVLSIVRDLVEHGETVVYLDEENGPDVVAERLRSMNADMAAVDQYLHYFPFPRASRGEIGDLINEIRALEPALVVFDAKADFLAAADLDEDAAMDTTTWHSEAVQPLLDVGASVVELDHSGHKDKTRARGSSAKTAVAEASWILKVQTKFDPESVGQVRLERGQKNRRGALPPAVSIRLGGTPLQFEVLDADESQDTANSRFDWIRKDIKSTLRAHGELSQNQLTQLVNGTATDIREQAKDLVHTPGSGVRQRPGPRGAILYAIDPDEVRL